ncbi:helix-turn-helix domain-containing protein [Hutsoniella sourekii]|uniref:helix-turn-helix domain-containing protein n=1 Tax=Hutsoniella sourekii TaxID=87650 RepID=UPI000485D3B8|nr:helix-turn-helix transcriptional regulator [Hutsoniella sourekii]
MSIGQQLKQARLDSSMTQEEVAEKIFVSRQSISNWENDKNYPDIISVIRLSELYQISLDQLLKGSENYVKHLEESTDVVKSNTKLAFLIVGALMIMIAVLLLTQWFPERITLVVVFTLATIITAIVYHEIIRRF